MNPTLNFQVGNIASLPIPKYDSLRVRPLAKEAINILDEKELAQIFKYFGDEKDSNRIAHNIVEDRATRKITTEELVRIIESSKRKNNSKTHSATKVFQALRIFVNKEISELIYGLINAAKVVVKVSCIDVMSAEIRLLRSPTRLS